MAYTPQQNPSADDLTRELTNAAIAVQERPKTWGKSGRARKKGQSEQAWLTNWAYYETYPNAPDKIDLPEDAVAAAAWKRISAEVTRLLALSLVPNPGWAPGFITWPLARQPDTWTKGGAFGVKRPWFGPEKRRHTGLDLKASAGTPVLATEPGTVVDPDSGWEGDVTAVIVHTDSGKTLLFGGVRRGSAVVVKGQRVDAGQQLAEIGYYPGGGQMLHFSGYDGLLSKSELAAQKSWSGVRPANLLDMTQYLEMAMLNPKYGVVGLVVPGGEDVPGLLENNMEGSEMNEGVDTNNPTDVPVTAAGGRTAAMPCLGYPCTTDDALAWQTALQGYRAQVEPYRKSQAKKTSVEVKAALAGLTVVDQFIAQMNSQGAQLALPEFITLHVEACQQCVLAGKALMAAAESAPAKKKGGGSGLMVGAAVAGVATLGVLAYVLTRPKPGRKAA